MKAKQSILFTTTLVVGMISWNSPGDHWLREKHKGYILLYTSPDKKNRKDYRKFIETGIRSVKTFFNSVYNREFTIVIHPDRHSLDSSWQKDWNMPSFKSECWMVASGVARKLDMISPKRWDAQACEHIYSATQKTQQLITHELVHVYHGQQNSSPDFSNVEGIDWFVEGLATFASGQCDTGKITEVKKAINGNKIPGSLDKFWTGPLRYGLSGSLVMYIDHKYGREKVKEILPFNKNSEILSALKITEPELLLEWKNYIMNL